MLDYLVDYKRERRLYKEQVRSFKSFEVGEVLYVPEYNINFKLCVLL